MSTNSECLFIEIERGKWFYILEDYSAPKNAWDWREHASCYGPFASEAEADQHLCDSHASPGGACIAALGEGEERVDIEKDPVLKGLIEGAHAPRPRGYGDHRYRF